MLWQAWTAPAARAVWAAPSPSVTVEFLEADTRVGGREVSLCKVEGQPDIRLRVRLAGPAADDAQRELRGGLVRGRAQSAALVTADISGAGDRSRLVVTVQLSSLATDMAAGYREGFDAGLNNLAGAAERTMVLQRVIERAAQRGLGRVDEPETLPQWWGPDGFSCRTKRIDLRAGGEWVFDMIGPDGTVFPNHHRYGEVRPEERIGYALLWGENGPKHADRLGLFEDRDGATKVTLGMVFSTAAEFQDAKGFGAVELGCRPWASWSASSHPGESRATAKRRSVADPETVFA